MLQKPSEQDISTSESQTNLDLNSEAVLFEGETVTLTVEYFRAEYNGNVEDVPVIVLNQLVMNLDDPNFTDETLKVFQLASELISQDKAIPLIICDYTNLSSDFLKSAGAQRLRTLTSDLIELLRGIRVRARISNTSNRFVSSALNLTLTLVGALAKNQINFQIIGSDEKFQTELNDLLKLRIQRQEMDRILEQRRNAEV